MKDNSILPMVGKRIRQIRKLKGFTQEELGEKCGFHFSYIGGVERAEKNISLINVQKLADALEVPVQEFFSYERSSSRKNSERENVMTEVNELLIEMKTSDLKKVKLFLSEIMSNK
ncbi:helix-turn-helix domain-containing protein [Paenibacillus alginolyticus]|uniref:helix-turn-helix domain-containing protein n=1 Tax=Paenibacillus alginolyticus TaxID=59839 RepID=UPI0004139D5A|nr:helix-turn-helix transcriptional regulator [Paenibacillus alginolyticus]MCY9670672.1 helix-turn-helix domain-containing protein [Paenibacillus alginolyticus]